MNIIEANILTVSKNNELKKDINLEKSQEHFLDSMLGKAINGAVDIGIRAIFPNFIDEQIVNLKDNLIENGFKDGLKKTIDDTIELGKSTVGIFNGNFENISQMHDVVKRGGIIDGVSSLLNVVIIHASKSGLIDKNIANTILRSKEVILNNVEQNIETSFMKQYKYLDNLNTSTSRWKDAFENKDFDVMTKEYKKIEKNIKEIVPIEKNINQARTIEILHNMIKNNGQDFNLTNEQLELVEKLK